MNRAAWLITTIGALEWPSPPRMTIAMWKKLTADEKAKLSAAVQREIKSALAEGRDPRRGRRARRRE